MITPTGTPRPDPLDLSKSKAAPEGAAEMARRKGKAMILLADDEAMNVTLLSRGLGGDDRYFFKSSDGIEALAVLRSVKVNLVISDLMMPNMDGLGLLAEVKKLQPGAGFILASGDITDDERKKALGMGADAVFDKPYDMSLLKRMVAEVLAMHPLDDSPSTDPNPYPL